LDFPFFKSVFLNRSIGNKQLNVLLFWNGNFIDYFTINEYKAQRAGGQLLITIYKYYDQIRNNTDRWYEKSFSMNEVDQ